MEALPRASVGYCPSFITSKAKEANMASSPALPSLIGSIAARLNQQFIGALRGSREAQPFILPLQAGQVGHQQGKIRRTLLSRVRPY
jgi:hypothetical protein